MHNQFMDEAARRQYREADALGTCMHALSELDQRSLERVERQLLDWIHRVQSKPVPTPLIPSLNPNDYEEPKKPAKVDMRCIAQLEPYRCGDAYEVPEIPA